VNGGVSTALCAPPREGRQRDPAAGDGVRARGRAQTAELSDAPSSHGRARGSRIDDRQFNIMHVCGAGAHFGEFADYPVAAFSWALAPGNPSLAEGHRRTGRAVMGGIPANPEIGSMTPVEIGAHVSAATADTEGRWLLLAPDCSITPDTPDVLLHAARQARDASASAA